ncbi:ROK family transcriptional regulator [Paenibacillus sp.]|uniref:ROK family transcriptional regulator n=1 Tax=Paenibacillus sp. TaxID=58172 RepID=UPI002D4F8D1D|nr:ROK family transcriptional regulator [Paenibacillus sp.]HZG58253.1 ROK family transcriptional regulator [Paenibacillus sp.]
MKMTGDQTLIKRMNKSLVLDTIRSHAPISRADIAAKLGLNKATVSSLVAEWLDERLVLETGLGESSGGRKPVMLLFHREAGHAIGVDLGVNTVSAVLTDLSGAILARERRRLRVSAPADAALVVCDVVRSLARSAPEAPYGVVGVGLGVPGIVDDAGVVLTAPNFGWRDAPLRGMLEAELGLRVVLDNEANVGAVGEKQFGIGRDAGDLVYVSAGVGIGTGLIVGHELYRGASGFSGELGHMTIQADGGRPCSCGSAGCWEMYASEIALTALGDGAAPELRELEGAVRLAEAGDAAAIAVLEAIGRYLGIGVATAVNAFNPEMIIVGNRLALARRWLEAPLREAAASRALRHHLDRARIEFASLGLDSAALGAASLAISRFLDGAKAGGGGPPGAAAAAEG